MGNHSPTQDEVNVLNNEYEIYIEQIKRDWTSRNQVESKNVFEVMDEVERKLVGEKILSWGTYITPLAEAWWKQRGFGVIWPDDSSKPMKLYRLDNA